MAHLLAAGPAPGSRPTGHPVRDSLAVLATFGLLLPGFEEASAAVHLEPVLTQLDSPMFVTGAPDGSHRRFIVEQGGVLKVLAPGASAPAVFLDISDRVLFGGEQGLLGLAFRPRFADNARFFVNDVRKVDGATAIAEYRVAPGADRAGTDEILPLVIARPFANHRFAHPPGIHSAHGIDRVSTPDSDSRALTATTQRHPERSAPCPNATGRSSSPPAPRAFRRRATSP